MDFRDDQIERYSRHIILSEVGVEGQEKLLNSKVLIIGTGGLGAPAAMFLAAAGVHAVQTKGHGLLVRGGDFAYEVTSHFCADVPTWLLTRLTWHDVER